MKPISSAVPQDQQYERSRNWANALERFLLGAAIADSTGYTAADTVAIFQEEYFTDPLHRAVFRAIRSLLGRGAHDLDVGIVIAELQHQGTFSQFPNATSYVCSLTEGAVAPPTRDSRLFRLRELGRAWSELDRVKKENVGD